MCKKTKYVKNEIRIPIKDVFSYYPIIKRLIPLISFFIFIIYVYYEFNSLLSTVLAILSPFIAFLLASISNKYSDFLHEFTLKTAVIKEMKRNLDNVLMNENILKFENNENSFSTDPIVFLDKSVFDNLSLYFSSKSLNFDMEELYDYYRIVNIINEAIKDRKHYSLNDFSIRKRYNDLLLHLEHDLIKIIGIALKIIHGELIFFSKNESEEFIINTLNERNLYLEDNFLDDVNDDLYLLVDKNYSH